MSRGMRRWVIALLVVLALLTAADRISLVVAENVAASTIKSSQHLASTPSVSVKGFPFLTQLISGSYDEIDVQAHGVQVDPAGHPLRVDSVGVALRGVHLSHGFSVLQAKSAVATAMIKYADLSHTLGTTVSYAGAGRLTASASVTVAGVNLGGSVTARPELTSASTLSFADPKISVLGFAAPDALDQALTSIFATTISLAGLPFGLHFDAIEATQRGVVIELRGSNLVYESRSG